MTKRSRTILFIICIILFALIAPTVVFYSQGYRFDFEKKKIVQTGGLYLRILPSPAEIYLNGKLKKKTTFLFGSTLIENLLPKTYQVQIKKEGYHSWQKSLEIKEKQVTEVKNIVLFPKEPNFEILIKKVNNFWFSPDEKKIATYELEDGNWALKLYELEKKIKSRLIGETDIHSKGADLLNLEFSEDSKEIYLNVGIKEQEKNFALDLNKSPPVLAEKKVTPLPENVITSQNLNNKVYYLDNSGYVFETDSSSPQIFFGGLKINEKPFPVQKETEYKLRVFQNYIFLQESKALYLFNPASKSFEKFLDEMSNLKISPDLKKLVLFSRAEVWVLFLKGKLGQLPQEEKIFLTRVSEKIGNVFWLNSDYLIFNSGEKIKIVEIDNRDKINIIDLAEFKNPEIFWNLINKKIYILSEENLYSSTPLFP